MDKIGIVYYSRSGNTEKMAEFVSQGVKMEGLKPELKKVEETVLEDLLSWDGIIWVHLPIMDLLLLLLKIFLIGR